VFNVFLSDNYIAWNGAIESSKQKKREETDKWKSRNSLLDQTKQGVKTMPKANAKRRPRRPTSDVDWDGSRLLDPPPQG
jgi:hypothetical protein